MKRLATMCITTLVLLSNVVAGGVYKCIDAAGNVSYSSTSCPRNSYGGWVGDSSRPLVRDFAPLHRGQLNQIHGNYSDPYWHYSPKDYKPSITRQPREIKYNNNRARSYKYRPNQ